MRTGSASSDGSGSFGPSPRSRRPAAFVRSRRPAASLIRTASGIWARISSSCVRSSSAARYARACSSAMPRWPATRSMTESMSPGVRWRQRMTTAPTIPWRPRIGVTVNQRAPDSRRASRSSRGRLTAYGKVCRCPAGDVTRGADEVDRCGAVHDVARRADRRVDHPVRIEGGQLAGDVREQREVEVLRLETPMGRLAVRDVPDEHEDSRLFGGRQHDQLVLARPRTLAGADDYRGSAGAEALEHGGESPVRAAEEREKRETLDRLVPPEEAQERDVRPAYSKRCPCLDERRRQPPGQRAEDHLFRVALRHPLP